MIDRLTNSLLANTIAPDWRLRLDWDWPLWATGLFCVAAVVWVVTIYLREPSTLGKWGRALLIGLRLISLALVCWMLAQPTVELFRTDRGRLVLLLDRSASMATRDAANLSTLDKEASRLEMWQHLLAGKESGIIEQLDAKFQIEILTFDEKIVPLQKSQARLAERLQKVKVADAQAGGLGNFRASVPWRSSCGPMALPTAVCHCKRRPSTASRRACRFIRLR